uniref:Uncharacterized protein n=2 Tax=Anguilla anguilla TaxID=7936 RepID=A0A0E9QXC6_ANGAN
MKIHKQKDLTKQKEVTLLTMFERFNNNNNNNNNNTNTPH